MNTNKTSLENESQPSCLGAVSGRTDVWNPMVKLMNQHPDAEVRRKAEILLGQYNTAGGIRIKCELEFMLQEYGY